MGIMHAIIDQRNVQMLRERRNREKSNGYGPGYHNQSLAKTPD
jgi:hypothetical protein